MSCITAIGGIFYTYWIETLGHNPVICVLTCPPGDSVVHSSLKIICTACSDQLRNSFFAIMNVSSRVQVFSFSTHCCTLCILKNTWYIEGVHSINISLMNEFTSLSRENHYKLRHSSFLSSQKWLCIKSEMTLKGKDEIKVLDRKQLI